MRYWKTQPVPGNPLVTLVVVAYNRGPQVACLLNSLRCQTYRNFEVLTYHDGPHSPEWAQYYRGAVLDDPRFTLVVPKVRRQMNGHPMRREGLARAKGEYVGLMNDDGYYCPVYLEALLRKLAETRGDMAYCDMVHSHKFWAPVESKLQRGKIDVGNWLARTRFVRDTPWDSNEFAADWFLISEMIKRGARIHKVKGTYFVHN